MTRDIAQNQLLEKDIPIAIMGEKEFETLKVVVDGYEADLFIEERYGSDKIVIIYKNKHPKFGNFFTTKYFLFDEPGIMSWGHDNKKMKIMVL